MGSTHSRSHCPAHLERISPSFFGNNSLVPHTNSIKHHRTTARDNPMHVVHTARDNPMCCIPNAACRHTSYCSSVVYAVTSSHQCCILFEVRWQNFEHNHSVSCERKPPFAFLHLLQHYIHTLPDTSCVSISSFALTIHRYCPTPICFCFRGLC